MHFSQLIKQLQKDINKIVIGYKNAILQQFDFKIYQLSNGTNFREHILKKKVITLSNLLNQLYHIEKNRNISAVNLFI